jgi:hypothetical protein
MNQARLKTFVVRLLDEASGLEAFHGSPKGLKQFGCIFRFYIKTKIKQLAISYSASGVALAPGQPVASSFLLTDTEVTTYYSMAGSHKSGLSE